MKDGIVVIRKMQAEKRENRIRGMVVDSNRDPIPGASIIVKGTVQVLQQTLKVSLRWM